MTNRTIQPLKFGEETVYIEISDVEQVGKSKSDEFEKVSAIDKVTDAGRQIQSTIKALSGTVLAALSDSKPTEWSMEINLGFKGKGGIPFITEGEAAGAVKVTAKWQRK